MRKIGLKDFYNYKYISSMTLSPKGDKLAYIVSTVNEEDNDYDSNLFMLRRDAAGKSWTEVQLVSDGKAGEFFFEDNDTILFSAKRGKDKKKGEEEPITVLQRLSLGGGEAKKAYEFPIPVTDLRKQPDGNYLLIGQTLTPRNSRKAQHGAFRLHTLCAGTSAFTSSVEYECPQ